MMNNKKTPLHVSQFTDTLNLSSPPSPSMCFPSPNKNLNKHDKRDNHPGLCGCQRAPKSNCISAIGVLILVILYTAMGSIIFVTLEGEIEDVSAIETAVAESKHYPRPDLENAKDIRSRTVDRLWSITEDLNILYKDNWTRLAAQEVQIFQDTLLRAVRASKIQQPGTQPSVPSHKWSYASAFLYSLTLITTIGYGGISPRTQWGRIAALIYALFGIPIVLLYLSAMGEGLSAAIRCLFRVNHKTRKNHNKTSSSSTSTSSSSGGSATGPDNSNGGSNNGGGGHHNYNHHSMKMHNTNNPYKLTATTNSNGPNSTYSNPSVPISICIMILICYISLGAVLFHKIQNWGVLEAVYFCFTALGTIGFGDLSPTGNLSQYLASAYILFGMAVVAMCFSLIQTELILWLRKFGVQDPIIMASSAAGGNGSGSQNDDVALVSVAVTPKS